jgi:hypothetical protein
MYINVIDVPLVVLLSGLGNQEQEAWPSSMYLGNRNELFASCIY